MEQLLISEISKLRAFKKFFAENSELSRLFALPSTYDNAASLVNLDGLQTRSSIDQLLLDRFGTINAPMMPSTNASGGGDLQSLRNQLNSFNERTYKNGSVDNDIPGKVNSQRVKTLKQRIEVGYNIQSQRSQYYFPATSDLGLSLGDKLSAKSTMGIGASYKVGLGNGWNDIKISHQGVSLRSFYDLQFKGSMFFSGGYEMNYRSIIHSVDILKDKNSWQKSGLIGVGKQYKLRGKMKGDIKILWDFLSYNQVPRTQSIIWRFGYKLN